MKAILILALSSSILTGAHAGQPLEEILQRRDAALSELLEFEKSGRDVGRTSEFDVYEATIRLYSFRRDSAKSKAERIKWQELIVAEEQEMASTIKKQVAIGVRTTKDELLAQERILAANQKLAELGLEK